MFSSIVVGTDGSDTATRGGPPGRRARADRGRDARDRQRLRAGDRRSAARRARGRLARPALGDQGTRGGRLTLGAAAALAREAGVAVVNVYPRQGDPADAILDVAEERGADLIVIGNKGLTGAQRFLLGSVPNKVSHHAPCSVLIIRTG